MGVRLTDFHSESIHGDSDTSYVYEYDSLWVKTIRQNKATSPVSVSCLNQLLKIKNYFLYGDETFRLKKCCNI